MRLNVGMRLVMGVGNVEMRVEMVMLKGPHIGDKQNFQ